MPTPRDEQFNAPTEPGFYPFRPTRSDKWIVVQIGLWPDDPEPVMCVPRPSCRVRNIEPGAEFGERIELPQGGERSEPLRKPGRWN